MATEKRLTEIIECLRNCANNTDCERCSRWLHPCDEKCVDDLMASAAEELEKFANAVEVVHGYWRYYSATMQECSNCKRHTARHKFKYCPHCGAVMEDKYNDGQ